jgi:hypothetical protein
MSEEHKAALAQGRRESRTVKAYLAALGSSKPGRPVTKESLESQLAAVDAKLEQVEDPLRRLDLIQRRLDLENASSSLANEVDLAALEIDFVRNASSYSSRRGISYAAWRQAGVPASVLKKAGIPQTRRR